ncbi:MAG TPA: 3-isopropylmalate dehydrogenase [Acidimicrobiia bacterium]|nr:3-isopropylmalate dehydrogenase [Acidimicrobiia bacterium]
MKANVVLLPGDGIGPEVVGAAAQVLERVADIHGHRFETTEHLIGGCAIDATGEPLPEATLEAAKDADAILLGAVGGPKWSDPHASTRPEQGLLAIRSELGLFANVRPIVAHDQLLDASPLRRDLIEGVDIVFYRELTGGIYFGGSTTSDDGTEVADHMRYSVGEIERIVRLAGDAARMRRGKVTSVDKANVLAVSRLWRRTADRIMADEYPDVEFENQLVDAMAMHLISRPRDFDVIVTGNLFGDILSDEASMIPGSLGLLPSASIGSSGPGLYEPIHGSAPDIAGTGTANPLAMILSAAMALRHSLGLPQEAASVELAVSRALDDGVRTPDIAFGGPTADTATMTAAVISHLG